MTQKELLYFEDAIEHEKNIIKIANSTIEGLDNEDLISFMKDKVKSHEVLLNKLMDFLEEKTNG